MNETAEDSVGLSEKTKYVRAHRKREQERRKFLDSKGLTDVRVPVTKQQAQAIKGMVKLLRKDKPNLTVDDFLFAICQPVMKRADEAYNKRLQQQVIESLQAGGSKIDPGKVRVEFGDPDEVLKKAGKYAVVVSFPDEDSNEMSMGCGRESPDRNLA